MYRIQSGDPRHSPISVKRNDFPDFRLTFNHSYADHFVSHQHNRRSFVTQCRYAASHKSRPMPSMWRIDLRFSFVK
jgi:hypothetical protein